MSSNTMLQLTGLMFPTKSDLDITCWPKWVSGCNKSRSNLSLDLARQKKTILHSLARPGEEVLREGKAQGYADDAWGPIKVRGPLRVDCCCCRKFLEVYRVT